MTRMTGPDCAVMCNLINTHTHTHCKLSLGRDTYNTAVGFSSMNYKNTVVLTGWRLVFVIKEKSERA